MGDALKATGRQIVYSVCNWGHEEPWLFGPNVGASQWRTTGDITDDWASVLSLLDQQVGLEPFARKGFCARRRDRGQPGLGRFAAPPAPAYGNAGGLGQADVRRIGRDRAVQRPRRGPARTR